MHEQIKVVVASGASTSSSAQFSRIFGKYAVQVGTMSTGMVFGVHASTDGGSSYYQVINPVNANTSTVTNITLQVGTNVGANGGFIVLEGGYKDLKFVLTGVVSGGCSFNVIGYDQ